MIASFPCDVFSTNGRNEAGLRFAPQTDMKNIQSVILYLASAIGVWLLVSFGGAMFDSVNAAFWSSSLMWSILSFLIVMPALALMSDFSPASSASSKQSTTDQDEAPSFVDENNRSERTHTLWPEAQSTDESPEWPKNATTDAENRDRVRA